MSANVRSLDAIEAVRAALLAFREELEQAVTMIDLEIRRTLDWLEHDRPGFWRRQLREAQDGVTQARAALHRCLMYPINDERPSCYEERAELKKAEARQKYCDEKSERLRYWIREVRHEVFEYEGRISQMKEIIEYDVPRSIAILDRLLVHLHDYQSIRTHSTPIGLAASAASAPSFGTESMARELMPDEPAPATAAAPAPTNGATPAEDAT
jgi:hypothetical protein